MFKKSRHETETPPPSGTPRNLRRVTVRALTDAGWIAGTIHVPVAARLVDYMDRAPSFLSLSDVFMEAHSKGVPFFALRHEAITFISVGGEEDASSTEDGGIMDDHSVSCLLPGGVLKGKVAVKPTFRLSDYLLKHHRFVPVRVCTYHVRVPQTGAVANEAADFVLLNAQKIIGLSERGDPLNVGAGD